MGVFFWVFIVVNVHVTNTATTPVSGSLSILAAYVTVADSHHPSTPESVSVPESSLIPAMKSRREYRLDSKRITKARYALDATWYFWHDCGNKIK